MILTLSCDRAARLLSDAEDRRLTFVERLALRGHLFVCVWCRRYRAQIRLIDDCVRHHSTSRTGVTAKILSDAARLRIRTKIADELGGPHG
jgi:hypothetical protein